MTSGLQFDWTDPRTGVDYPTAFLVIDDARVHLAPNQAVLGTSIYGDAALAAANRGAILSDPDVQLSPQELQVLRDAFTDQLYQILASRYPGSQIVP